ncbi:MAG: hypothetical protein ACKV0T_05150, partial [Planctomycetales bacterium]
MTTTSFSLTNSRLNSNKGTFRGNWPVPSSLHPGIVIVATLGGAARPVSENIDASVYIRLISSGGSKRGQVPMSDNDW